LSTKVEVALSSARGWLLGLAAGLFSGGLQKGMDYAKERYQGGDLLWNHTGFRTILSKLQTTLWSAETIMEKIPQVIQEEGRGPWAVRQNFAEAMESLIVKVEDIIQVFGGYGYMEDFIVERVFRDVTHLSTALGRRGFDRTAWT
jgi:alkylation response protein AidB-like acyl-CoA dehydrogenase